MLNRTLTAALLAACAGALAVAAASSSAPPPETSGRAQIGSFGLDPTGGDRALGRRAAKAKRARGPGPGRGGQRAGMFGYLAHRAIGDVQAPRGGRYIRGSLG